MNIAARLARFEDRGFRRETAVVNVLLEQALQCAGLNRHEVEDERALRERNSDPLGLESCAGYREVHSEA